VAGSFFEQVAMDTHRAGRLSRLFGGGKRALQRICVPQRNSKTRNAFNRLATQFHRLREYHCKAMETARIAWLTLV